MRFHLLGPLEVLSPTATDPDTTPRAAKHRAILATLLVRAGEPVPTETLISELWGDTPPRTATTTIQVYISQLRKFLNLADSNGAGQAIVTRRPGYLFRLDPGQLDLTLFEALYEQGLAAAERQEHARASDLLGEALALWRGRFLADTPAGPLLSAEGSRLSEMRVSALEQRIRADLQLGRHQELLGVLRTATAEHPLREELHAHLMVALYRSGRQAEALQVFAALRRTLVDELAIEPGPSLQRLHQRLLSGDPKLLHAARDRARTGPTGAPPPPPARFPPPDPRFAGRSAELAEVCGLLREGVARVLVTGAPGTGKSALARHAAHLLKDAFPEGRVLADLRTAPSTTPAEITERLLHAAGAPAPLPDTPAARLRLLRRLTEGRGLLLVLDNADLAGDLSTALPDQPGITTLITARHRPGGLGPAATVRIGLPDQATAEAIFTTACESAAAQTAPETVEEITALCGRLPLALRAAGARLAAHPHWTAATFVGRLRPEETRLDELRHDGLDVRAWLLHGYERCAGPERDAFRMLSVLPPGPFDAASATAVLDVTPEAATALLEQLVGSGLLDVAGSGGSALASYRLPRLYRLLALELGAADPAGARHAAIGRLCEAYARTAEWSRPGAGLSALVAGTSGAAPGSSGPRALHWYTEQRSALVRTVREAADAGQWRPALRLARAIGDFLEAIAAWDDWATVQEAALRAAEAVQDEDGRAWALRFGGDLAWQRREFDGACRCYRDALRVARRARNPAEEARSLAGLADLHLEHGSSQDAAALAAEARAAADASQDQRALFEAQRCQALVALDAGRSAEAEKFFACCVETATELADRRLEAYARRSERAAAVPDGLPGTFVGVEVRPGVSRLGPAPSGVFGRVPEPCGINPS
ncbi:BTAD domain-containing putative transcriptional regulator [Streptomyces sp. NPDC003032]